MKKIRFIFIIVFIAAVVFFYKNGMSGGVSVIRNWIHDRTDDTILDEDTNEKRGQTIEGVFLDHKAVCGGYAAAYKYLCDLAGLKLLRSWEQPIIMMDQAGGFMHGI